MMQQLLNKVLPWFWAAVWFTLPVSMKANGLSLILLGSVALLYSIYFKPVPERKQLIMGGLFIVLFCWQSVSMLFDADTYATWKSLERKLSFIAIPVIMVLISGTREDLEKWAIRGFFAGLVVTGIHMLSLAFYKIITGNSPSAFTYHAFTGPYSLGAIYYSWFLSAGIYYLAFRDGEYLIRKFRVPLSLFLLLLLLLCASKLFIILTIPALIWLLARNISAEKGRKRVIVPIIVIIVLLAGSAPFFNRITELKNTNLEVVKQDHYRYDTPLNGLTYRMILWRFAGEIMKDENAWLTGTGIGSRQKVLDAYYVNYGIYTGNPDLGDTGYLGYNFHNEYLEIMVGTGVPGLVILLSIAIFSIFFQRGKLFFPLMVYIMILIFFITESVLERQAGIVFFCLLLNYPNHSLHKI